MKRKILSIALALCLMFTATGVSAGTVEDANALPKDGCTDILMIGNSLTSRENGDNKTIPYLQKFASQKKIKMKITKVTHSGETMKNWANPKNTYGKKAYAAINSQKWDVIIMQDNTDWAVAKSSESQAALKKLTAYIKSVSPNTRVIYNATWAYDKTVKRYGRSYSYTTQRRNINNTYTLAARASGAEVIYSGNAFHAYKSTKGAKNLYLSDKNHPSRYGAMMNASCIFHKVFGVAPGDYRSDLSSSAVKKIKAYAVKYR